MKRLTLCLAVLASFFAAMSVYAQGCGPDMSKKPEDYGIKSKRALQTYQMGEEAMCSRQYQQAADIFDQALQLEPNFAHAHYKRAASLCLLREPMYAVALPSLERCIQLKPNDFPLAYFYLGEAYTAKSEYAKAIPHLKKTLELKKIKAEDLIRARIDLRKAEFAIDAMNKPIKYDPKNLGQNINTKGEEYMPSITADGGTLYFTSRREGCTGGFSPITRSFTEDIYSSVKKDDVWQPAVNLGAPINTPHNEGTASFTPDGQFVFFTGCDREDGNGSCDIYMSKLEGATWSAPINLGPKVNSVYWDSQPCISNDGKTLYFVSVRPGGLGGHDIWYTRWINGEWTTPKNLEAPVNTQGEEFYPFLHADGKTMYFSSDLHTGFGGLDIFKTKFGKDGWGDPENLGHPLNTPYDEAGLVVDRSGQFGFLSSSRYSEFGLNDIYMFEMDEKIRPEFVTFVRGIVSDSLTRLPLGSKVMFIDLETQDTIRDVNSNSATGKFLLSLPVERDYAAFVEAPGYAFTSLNFSLKGMKNERYFELDVRLKAIKTGEIFVLKNIFFEFDKADLKPESEAELNKLVTFMKQNKKITIELGGHTDNQGKEDYNLTLSESRAKAVRDYLIKKGIAVQRIEAKGYGAKAPKVANDTEANRAVNRRTEVKILKTE